VIPWKWNPLTSGGVAGPDRAGDSKVADLTGAAGHDMITIGTRNGNDHRCPPAPHPARAAARGGGGEQCSRHPGREKLDSLVHGVESKGAAVEAEIQSAVPTAENSGAKVVGL